MTIAAISLMIAAITVAGCGTGGTDAAAGPGAQLFAQRCSGCHTLKVAGAQGTANRSQRTQGPDFDQRFETFDDAIYAIGNGGFSGAIMPQNIVVGDDAVAVARFLADYSGSDVEELPTPGQP